MDARTERFIEARNELWARPDLSGSGRRRLYADLVDAWLADLFAVAGSDQVALVAVGGTGRRELAPGSDLDLVLLHRAGAREVSAVADRLWYPIWDSGLRLDHSVRTPEQVLSIGADDLKAAIGLLDLRHVAGDASLAGEVRERALAQWRAGFSAQMPLLRSDAAMRAEQHGELAYLLEPDLKESYGGLREATNLRALEATWVVDPPRAGVADALRVVLDIRDALHVVTGRPSDRLLLQEQEAVAHAAGYGDADAVLRAVCAAGRTLAFAADTAWYRAERALRRPRRRIIGRRASGVDAGRRPLGDGVIEVDGEVVLARDADPAVDAGLGLRAASVAAQNGLVLAPSLLDRVVESSIDLPVPWPRDVRESFVALLGAGPAALSVWEAVDQAGLWERWLPGWARLRALPQRNPVHRFTVDRHLVEVALQAAALTRRVARPDLLLVGALLHDVGKGLPGDHTEQGLPLVEAMGDHMGFDPDDVATLVDLCRYHLLLPDMATRRDLDDPATVSAVAAAVGTHEFLDLLHALTEADARGTGPLAWTEWRASLINDLVGRTHAALRGEQPVRIDAPPPDDPLVTAQGLVVEVEAHGPVWRVSVAADDRSGLLATVAGVLSVNRLAVRAASLSTVSARAVQVWTVQPDFGDPPTATALREDLRAVMEGRLDLSARLRAREQAYARPRIAVPDPRVDVHESASDEATVIEVRAHDGPALLHRVASAIAQADASVRSAQVATMGAEALDVFYLVNEEGRALPRELTAGVVGAILDELMSPLPSHDGRRQGPAAR
jgi:[protein-PII] uridylyltransferase